jgi:prepilin-type N-terminal cleavage/methylation domain-containing protein
MAQDPSVASLLQDDDKRGFTLIEMSIVLVIIGLIIGGILVGRDLIKAAEVTAQISQITKYNSAVNTFKNKYGGLPGDLMPTLVSQFGFTAGTLCDGSATGRRDGNGLIDGYMAPYYLLQGGGETEMFWSDLSTAGLIEGEFPNSGGVLVGCNSITALSLTPGTAYIGDFFPTGKIGYGTFVLVYETGGNNWFDLSNMSAISTGTGDVTSTAGIPAIEAYNIDKKMDDGLPTSGTVVAKYLNGPSTALQPAPTGPTDTTSTCYSGSGATSVYSLSATANGGSGLNCALSFKFQ